MEITKEYLQEKRACGIGIDWFNKTFPTGCTHVELCERLVERHDWALWLLKKSLSTNNLIKYAIHSAELVLHIYEKRYPDNDAPRKAIEAAKKYSNEPNEEHRLAVNAAADAAHAAYAAAYAAHAADAVYAAAYAAAHAAAHAADAVHAVNAADAADAAHAAINAAYAAAYAAAKMKIISFGVALLSEQET